MALKSLSVHYTRIINNDRVPIDFHIVKKLKKNREKKCIAYYINGFYLKNNLDLWKLHKNGQNVYKTLELSKGPDNTSDYLERGNQILSRVVDCMSHENKENIQVFVIRPLCRMLCSYCETHTNLELLKERVSCESCLCVHFSMEETQALNDFCHRFWNSFNVRTIHGGAYGSYSDILQIIFRSYSCKIKDKRKKTQHNTTNLDSHTDCTHYPCCGRWGSSPLTIPANLWGGGLIILCVCVLIKKIKSMY